MGTLWVENRDRAWVERPVGGFVSDAVHFVRIGAGSEALVAALFAPGAIARHNGLRLWGGLCVLRHKDEVLVNGSRLYYSTQMRPQVTPYQANAKARPTKCVVCRVPLREGDAIVQCPGCSRLFHQAGAKNCWTYRERCTFCDHPTSLTGESSWRPDWEEANV